MKQTHTIYNRTFIDLMLSFKHIHGIYRITYKPTEKSTEKNRIQTIKIYITFETSQKQKPNYLMSMYAVCCLSFLLGFDKYNIH